MRASTLCHWEPSIWRSAVVISEARGKLSFCYNFKKGQELFILFKRLHFQRTLCPSFFFIIIFFFYPLDLSCACIGTEAADIDFGKKMSMSAEGECFGSLWKIKKRHSKQRVVIEPVAHLAGGLNRKSPLFTDVLINDRQTARIHSRDLTALQDKRGKDIPWSPSEQKQKFGIFKSTRKKQKEKKGKKKKKKAQLCRSS